MLDEIHGARGINNRVGSVPGKGRQYCDISGVMSRRDGGMDGGGRLISGKVYR